MNAPVYAEIDLMFADPNVNTDASTTTVMTAASNKSGGTYETVKEASEIKMSSSELFSSKVIDSRKTSVAASLTDNVSSEIEVR